MDARAAFSVALPDRGLGLCGGDASISAEGADQRVVAVHNHGHAERAGLGDLHGRAALHEQRFDIGFEVFVDLVAAHEAGGHTLVWALEEVRRRIVVDVAAVRVAAAAVDVVGILARRPRTDRTIDIFVDREAARIGRAGATAGRTVIPHRARGIVALAVEERVILAPGQPAHRVATVVGKAAAHHQIDVLADAVEAGIALRHREASGFVQRLPLLVVVVVLVGRVASGEADTFEFVVQDEVDHAGNSVSAVNGRSTA